MKIVNVSKHAIKVQCFIPMDCIGMIKDPANGGEKDREQQEPREQQSCSFLGVPLIVNGLVFFTSDAVAKEIGASQCGLAVQIDSGTRGFLQAGTSGISSTGARFIRARSRSKYSAFCPIT